MGLKWERPELIVFSVKNPGPGEETAVGQCCVGSGEACSCTAGPGAMGGCTAGGGAVSECNVGDTVI